MVFRPRLSRFPTPPPVPKFLSVNIFLNRESIFVFWVASGKFMNRGSLCRVLKRVSLTTSSDPGPSSTGPPPPPIPPVLAVAGGPGAGRDGICVRRNRNNTPPPPPARFCESQKNNVSSTSSSSVQCTSRGLPIPCRSCHDVWRPRETVPGW